MAREFDDSGFWLPSEFLTEDELLTDFRADRLRAARFDDFSCGFVNSRSDLSSPGELVASTTETESEDDDLVSELTRKLAQSSLRDYGFSSDYASRGWNLSGSPQSTLCGCKPGPTVSPNSVSGFCSPPDAEDYLRRDFLYAAAKEAARMRVIEETAARMRLIEETAAFYSSKQFPPQAKPRAASAAAAPQLSQNSASSFYPIQARSNNHLATHLLQAAKMKKQQEMMKGGDCGPGVAGFQLQNGRRNGGDGRTQGASMADWPSLQQSGPGKRAVFLGEPGPRKERTGTGVFLPQRYGSLPTENRKKSSGCPTVLLPEKVVQALNINVDSIDAHLHLNTRDYGASTFDYDAAAAAAALKHRNNLMMAQQRRNLAQQSAINQQLRLPNDWTY